MNTLLTNLSRGIILSTLLVTGACTINGDRVSTGELQTESKTVALGAAKSVRVNLNMKAGELKVAGGASQLLEASFTYNVPRWQPDVKYTVSGDVGNLDVDQPESGHTIGHTRNEWDLHLNNKVPIDLAVDIGAGKATMTLGGMALRELRVDIGAGETTVDLTGDWKNNLSARIHGGVGKATVRLPTDVGVHVIAHGGLGAINARGFQKQGDAYVNEAYGKSPITLNIEVEGGVGEIDLEMGEAPPVV